MIRALNSWKTVGMERQTGETGRTYLGEVMPHKDVPALFKGTCNIFLLEKGQRGDRKMAAE